MDANPHLFAPAQGKRIPSRQTEVIHPVIRFDSGNRKGTPLDGGFRPDFSLASPDYRSQEGRPQKPEKAPTSEKDAHKIGRRINA
jgi:hypothetical protein